MAYQYTPSVGESKKYDKSSVGLYISHLLHVIISIFASTFLVSFIVNINAENPLSDSIVTISIYYISNFIVFGIVYFLMSYLVDRTSRIWLYRLGILLFGGFIVLLIFVGEELSQYIVLAGAVYGVAEGVYYSAYNVLKGEMVPRKNMSTYATLSMVFEKVLKVVFPVLLGYMIDASSFVTTAIFVLFVIVFQIGATFLVKAQRPDNSSFEFFKYLKSLRGNTEDIKRIKRIYNISWLYGFKTIFTTLFSIITIYTFKTNLKLGIFTSLSSFIAVLSLLFFKYCTKEGKRTALYVSLSILLVCSTITLSLFLNEWTYVIFNFCEAVCLTIIGNGIDIERNLVIKKTGHYSDIAEHNCVVELLFTISRVITYAMMFVLGLTLDIWGLKICVMISAIVMPIMSIMIVKMEKAESEYSLDNIQANYAQSGGDSVENQENLAVAEIENQNKAEQGANQTED